MPKEPSYYDILGLQPEADAAAVEAAYRGRSLRFRVGRPRTRGAGQTGPTQEQIEHAYAILGDPESRALYDAVYFPAEQHSAKRRRRLPIWLWAIIGVWSVALVAVVLFGLHSRTQGDGAPSGRIAGQTAKIVAAGGVGGTMTVASSGGGISPGNSPTIANTLPSTTATSTVPGATATVSTIAAATVTVAPTVAPSATQTTAPTVTVAPTNTATSQPPTATSAPSPTAVPPTAVPPTAVPPTAAPEPEPEPTATPSFGVTDRIGTTLSVNLRNGPGAAYPSLGLLPTGTLLQATGERATVGGQLWRRFLLQDGRVGWVRDLDVFSAR